MNENGFGDFSYKSEAQKSKWSEDVLLTALKRCEELEEQLHRACVMIGELNVKLQDREDFIKMLRGDYGD